MSSVRWRTLTALALAWLGACADTGAPPDDDDDDASDGDADADADVDGDADGDGDSDGDGDGDADLYACRTLGGEACDVAEVSAGGFYPWRFEATGLSAGHTCARLVSGELACWGFNLNGQLGDGESGPNADRPRPEPVLDVADAVQVAAGGAHTCALRDGGSVDCWGANARGQLGDGTTDDRARPTRVPDLFLEAQSIVAGARHTCVTRLDGQVSCWGDDSRGQLGTAPGDETCADAPCATQPATVEGLDRIVEVALGELHSCARDAVGSVWCWGSNTSGELGDGSFEDRSAPAVVPLVDPIVQVAAGGNQTCVLDQRGEVRCWGALYFDRNEDADPNECEGDPSPCRPAPTAVEGIEGATAIAVGKEHACALVAGGEVRCWGANRAGQLGDGTLQHRETAAPVLEVTEAEGIAAGRLHTCAWRADAVWCWGDDEQGQVGVDGTNAVDECSSRVGTPYPCQATPVLVAGLPSRL